MAIDQARAQQPVPHVHHLAFGRPAAARPDLANLLAVDDDVDRAAARPGLLAEQRVAIHQCLDHENLQRQPQFGGAIPSPEIVPGAGIAESSGRIRVLGIRRTMRALRRQAARASRLRSAPARSPRLSISASRAGCEPRGPRLCCPRGTAASRSARAYRRSA